MRAMVVPRWGEVSALREVAEPEAGPGEAVMKVRSAGVGLTLLNMRSGRFGGSTPRIMGHRRPGMATIFSSPAPSSSIPRTLIGRTFMTAPGKMGWSSNPRAEQFANHLALPKYRG